MLAMLLWYLLTILFAVSNGNLMCFYSKYSECHVPFLKNRDTSFCSHASSAMECLQKNAVECDVEDSRLVSDVKQGLMETCQEGTDLNKAYLRYETCVFGSGIGAAVLPCFKDLIDELLRFNHLSITNTSTHELGIYKVSCRYTDSVNLCINAKVEEICGEEAGRFIRKFKGPIYNLETRACMEIMGNVENDATSLNFISTLLLQVSAVLFAQNLSKNYI